MTTAVHVHSPPPSQAGGRFDFDDGGTYCGGWEEGKAHGHGVCTGPKGQGEYSGTWLQGFEVSGVYTWPTGTTYEGQWSDGKRHGLGVETRGRWIYRGEWTEGFKGRYGVRQCISSGAKYDGTWANGLQDGYGSETYADGGTFQGQWAKGMRHGYGVRSSAPFGLAAHVRRQSLKAPPTPSDNPTPEPRRPEEIRGGFVLKSREVVGTLGRSLPDQRSKGSSLKALVFRSKQGDRTSSCEDEWEEGAASGSEATDSSFVVQEDEMIDGNVIETYMGEWKNDRRNGFGIAERSDGIKYEGEWYNNKKFGYGRTTYKNGTEELGKYKNNELIASGATKHLFLLRSKKFRDRVEAAVSAAHRASHIALQKADIAISRTATARGKAEQAVVAAKHSRADSEVARIVAKQYAPEFHQPGSSHLHRKLAPSHDSSDFGKFHHFEDSSHRTFQTEASGRDYLYPEFDEYHLNPAPSQSQPSAFLDLFKNNPDRRPSAAGFLRRPSTANFARRPSTVVEHSIVPSLFDQQAIPSNPHRPQLSLQQVVDDHFQQYYEPKPTSRPTSPNKAKKPAIDLTELSKLYGIPLSHPPTMEDEENVIFVPHRRSTMPTVLDQNSMPLEHDSSTGEGMVRTGSLYSATRKMESSAKSGSIASSRKKSLPDISNISEPRVLTRETIAILSSQRREAIRKQEEEAQRLRANPLLYLLSPEIWDWLASQQLVILVLVINIAIGILFLKVIL